MHMCEGMWRAYAPKRKYHRFRGTQHPDFSEQFFDFCLYGVWHVTRNALTKAPHMIRTQK